MLNYTVMCLDDVLLHIINMNYKLVVNLWNFP